jgi:hypothetical protein
VSFVAALLFFTVDQYDDAAEKVRFPADEMRRQWAAKSETHEKLVKQITNRRGWAKAFQAIHEKLGLFPPEVEVEVVIVEGNDNRLAWSLGKDGKGTVSFNMKLLPPHQKKLDDIDQEIQAGKLAPWIIPPQRLDNLVTHELTHIVCGCLEEVWLSEGLATYAAGDEHYLYSFNLRGGRVESLDRALSEADAYPRGLSFFRWMEKAHGADKLREFAGRVAGGREKAGDVAGDVFGSSWARILAREKAWSAEYIPKFKTVR